MGSVPHIPFDGSCRKSIFELQDAIFISQENFEKNLKQLGKGIYAVITKERGIQYIEL